MPKVIGGLPVAARKGTWNYRAGKFVRRHRTVVGAATVVLSTLVAGIIVTGREARIAEAHRRRADARFNDVRKLANSLIFDVHDSIQYLPGATDVPDVRLGTLVFCEALRPASVLAKSLASLDRICP